jgi:8-hydroxy-5-deazaflavin:NADPH oxidoreductase
MNLVDTIFKNLSSVSNSICSMKIGIIGSGLVAQKLGEGISNLHYEVMLSSRDATKQELLDWVAVDKEHRKLGSFEEAAQFGELIIIATKWDGTENAIHLANIENFTNKTVIDVTNPLDFTHGMPPSLYMGHTNSGGETIQRILPKAHIVKSLNIINANHMVNPTYTDGLPCMMYCGNNEEAKKQVKSLLTQFGWSEIIDLGNIEGARLMEPLCILWVTYGATHNTWDHAFAILKK